MRITKEKSGVWTVRPDTSDEEKFLSMLFEALNTSYGSELLTEDSPQEIKK